MQIIHLTIPGEYTVKLRVTDSKNYVSDVVKTINVEEASIMAIITAKGITENFVTISKHYVGIILMTRLPVPAKDFGYRQKLPAYMNNVPASSSSGSVKSR